MHEHRSLIEATRIAGATLDSIAAKYGVSRDAVHRHCRPVEAGGHLSDDQRADYLAQVPLKELAQKAAAEGLNVLDYLSLIRSTLIQQLQLAASVNDRNGTANIARTLNETLRQIAGITGEMGALAARNITINNTTNFVNSPIFADLQGMLIRTLQPYPEALARVVEGLQQLEAKAAPVSNGAPLIDAKPLEAHVDAA
ncbi:hypothetical protein CK489_29140 [Bradyrhizobium sp. UFLA03-84]|nr:hypothetical protein CK489_29140 [Bradyrhizobium sp. UFLA03-84]